MLLVLVEEAGALLREVEVQGILRGVCVQDHHALFVPKIPHLSLMRPLSLAIGWPFFYCIEFSMLFKGISYGLFEFLMPLERATAMPLSAPTSERSSSAMPVLFKRRRTAFS